VICTGGARDSALQFFCCYDRRLLRYVVHSFFLVFLGFILALYFGFSSICFLPEVWGWEKSLIPLLGLMLHRKSH
jgi:hypothetical protein